MLAKEAAMIPPETDVVVVGAGPTGLLLAGDLAAAGVRATVLERRAEESNLTRAFGVHARTLEQLDARGLADELIFTGSVTNGLRLFGRVSVDLTRLPSRFPFLLVTPQYQVERLLRRRAEQHGAVIIGGAEVTGIRQDADGVEACLASGQRVRAAYLAGADGVHSRVRQQLGMPFPGESILQSLMLADVRLDNAPEGVLAFNAVGDCFAFLAPFGDGWYRIFAWDRRNQQPDTAPVDFEEIRDVARRALGTDYGMRAPRWMSRFHNDERQVPRYRAGRVFLAGDAAHVHSLAGGQGMNTGIQDAANLGWKLAASINGWAPDGLLDSYHDERHPVGQLVIRGSGTIIRSATIQSRTKRAARNIAGSAAMRIPPAARKIAGILSGIGIGYPAPRGSHPRTGSRAPDLQLSERGQPEDRLYQALRHGKFVLLAPPELTTAAEHWRERVYPATVPGADAPPMLIRPDGYIAWAARRSHPDRRDSAIADALTAHCGPATPRASSMRPSS
jgi:2-polyprenyl-6-methoxyphenol hydroxylase-like FAD-dependent oxidoreductase